MPSICKDYHANAGNYEAGASNSREYIVVHYTCNSAQALNEAKYAHNSSHGSSFHYVLDGGGTIYQTLEDWERSWSVGKWSGCTAYVTNAQAISIEVCNSGGSFTDAEIEELAWLVQLLMEKHGIDAEHVVRHYDCHSGRKSCPAYYVDQERWEALKATITGDDMSAEEVVEKLLHEPLWDGYEGKPKKASWGPDGEGTGEGYSIIGNVLKYIYDNTIEMKNRLDAIEDKIEECQQASVTKEQVAQALEGAKLSVEF